MEPEAGQAGCFPQRPPGAVPFLLRLRRVVVVVLIRAPEVMLSDRVSEFVCAFEYPRDGIAAPRRSAGSDACSFRFLLCPTYSTPLPMSPLTSHALSRSTFLASDVPHLDPAHRCVRRDDRRAVHVLPLGITGGGLEQPLLLLVRERPADGLGPRPRSAS